MRCVTELFRSDEMLERINERAPVIASTVEMAPQTGELLVLDEVQWADDEERGQEG